REVSVTSGSSRFPRGSPLAVAVASAEGVLIQRAWIAPASSRVTARVRAASDCFRQPKSDKKHNSGRPARRPGRPFVEQATLLERDLRALLLELGLGLVGVVLVDLLQDRLRRRLDQVLGLLEAKAGQLAHDLDDLDLLAAVGLQDDVELALLLDLLGRG